MAVFMLNICKFSDCGITFPSLGDLIQHIEDTHIDYDPLVIEQKEKQQPSCIPLSYVLRFFTDAAKREGLSLDVRRRLVHHATATLSKNIRTPTPTGSELDDDEVMSDTEDSNDSWTTTEEFSSEFILRYGSRNGGGATSAILHSDKPFACPVPGCKKRYKNINGIKYHSKNGHKKDGKIRKGYKCHCGKSYKTSQGLKNHTNSLHSGAILTSIQQLSTSSGSQTSSSSTSPTAVISMKHVTANDLKGLVIANNKRSTESLNKIDAVTLKTIIDTNKLSEIAANKIVIKKNPFKISKTVTATKLPTNNELNENNLGILTPATSPLTSSVECKPINGSNVTSSNTLMPLPSVNTVTKTIGFTVPFTDAEHFGIKSATETRDG